MISCPSACSLFFLFYRWFGMSLGGLFSSALMVFFAFMTLKFYTLASSTPPGTPPKDWVPSKEELAVLDKYYFTFFRERILKMGKKPHFCYLCEQNKPLLAHHCKECGTCILRRDHHCPWTTRCIGAQLFLPTFHISPTFPLSHFPTYFPFTLSNKRNNDFRTTQPLPLLPVPLLCHPWTLLPLLDVTNKRNRFAQHVNC